MPLFPRLALPTTLLALTLLALVGCGGPVAMEAPALLTTDQIAARADAVFIAYMELRNLTPENFARVEALRRRYEAELEAILRAGQAEGVMDLPDIRLAAMALIAMLTGVNTWFRAGGRLSLARVEEIYVDMALKSVGARPLNTR